MPVAIAPVDGQIELLPERRDQFPILGVDGTFAAEVIIVFGDLQHSLTRNVTPSQNIFEKRDNVFGFFGAAKGDDDERVVYHSCLR